jgi:voltage-gated potassium channel
MASKTLLETAHFKLSSMKNSVVMLYTGASQTSVGFRYALIIFDLLTIVYFIVTASWPDSLELTAISRIFGIVIFTDLTLRIWISNDRLQLLKRPYVIADFIVIASFFINPFIAVNLSFLRILRGLRLVHSYQLLFDLRRDSRFFRAHEDAIIASVNLLVFVFFSASAVFELYFAEEENSYTYIDALYFTVATLTTTGFGDITLDTPTGKLLSVFIMVVGVALFVQLARAIFQPTKVNFECHSCGLFRHDVDAVHCKHCGATLKIQTKGID